MRKETGIPRPFLYYLKGDKPWSKSHLQKEKPGAKPWLKNKPSTPSQVQCISLMEITQLQNRTTWKHEKHAEGGRSTIRLQTHVLTHSNHPSSIYWSAKDEMYTSRKCCNSAELAASIAAVTKSNTIHSKPAQNCSNLLQDGCVHCREDRPRQTISTASSAEWDATWANPLDFAEATVAFPEAVCTSLILLSCMCWKISYWLIW